MRSWRQSKGVTPLETKILAAFRQASRQHELEAAEHLMRALEVLAREADG